MAVVRGAAHTFMVERAGTFNRTVLDHLARVVEASDAAEPAPEDLAV